MCWMRCENCNNHFIGYTCPCPYCGGRLTNVPVDDKTPYVDAAGQVSTEGGMEGGVRPLPSSTGIALDDASADRPPVQDVRSDSPESD